jgi:outer membrane protein assembly factor BamB
MVAPPAPWREEAFVNRKRLVVPAIAAAALALVAATAVASAAATGAAPPKAAAKYDWTQFAFDAQKSANNTLESTVNLGNVSKLKPLFKTALPDAPDSAPVLLTDVTTPQGVKDLVYAQGEHGRLMAFDAHTGTAVWSTNFGPGGISNSGPAIDPNRQFIYLNANDGKVHKVKVGDGAEVTGGGWPQMAGPGKSSSALTIATAKNGHTYLYASNQGGGHITTIDLGTGTQHVFNLACSQKPDAHAPSGCGKGANPWARGPAYDPSLDLFFQMAGTNNGTDFTPGRMWRQSWVALPADGHTTMKNGLGYPVDSYTPSNWKSSVRSDQDIGSGGLLILPVGISSKFPHLGVQPGKDSKIRLLNLANLSGKGAPGNTGGELQLFSFPKMGNMRSQGAVWTNPADKSVWVFVTGHGGVAGFQISVDGSGNPKLNLKWSLLNGWTSSAFVANGVLFAANGAGEHTGTQKLHQVQAINPTTGKVAWTGGIGLHHWSSPILANGVVYMVDGNSGGFGPGTSGNLIAWSL